MIEFLRKNIIPIMVVIAAAVFAYRFYKLTRNEKRAAEEKKSAEAEEPTEEAAEEAAGAEDEETVCAEDEEEIAESDESEQ